MTTAVTAMKLNAQKQRRKADAEPEDAATWYSRELKALRSKGMSADAAHRQLGRERPTARRAWIAREHDAIQAKQREDQARVEHARKERAKRSAAMMRR